MDELEKRIDSLLQDPDSMTQLTKLAEELLGGKDVKTHTESDADSIPDLSNLLRFKEVFSRFGGENDDSRLLLALKPYLKSDRQEKVDEAVKILKLLKLAPLIKELNV